VYPIRMEGGGSVKNKNGGESGNRIIMEGGESVKIKNGGRRECKE
jgi:hypothetical protein